MRKTKLPKYNSNGDIASKNETPEVEFIPGASGNFWLIFSSESFSGQKITHSVSVKKIKVHFDFQWHKVVCPDNSFQGDVSDEIYGNAMSSMKAAIKDGYGFEPQNQYGKNNYSVAFIMRKLCRIFFLGRMC